MDRQSRRSLALRVLTEQDLLNLPGLGIAQRTEVEGERMVLTPEPLGALNRRRVTKPTRFATPLPLEQPAGQRCPSATAACSSGWPWARW
jgi:hypothetical protein